ncbi:endonuclease G [Flexibacter flexilis DSM 6793]|uniref:Endonuclease n=2 Tax=Flexibacter flexilis TaxID=998 RepID=A0A1I1DDQ6_9BACT|nr:endonuclease G [Flexibacter flexilis DSM 6793]
MAKQTGSSTSYVKLIATIVAVVAGMWFYNKSDKTSSSKKDDKPRKPKQEVAETRENNSTPVKPKSNTNTSTPRNSSNADLPNYAEDEAFPYPKPYPNATKGRQIIHHTAYTLSYYEKHEQAEWVAYTLSAKDLRGKAEREKESFKADDQVEGGSATPQDYLGTGYDRGHLAPAADMKRSETAMEESFFMSNMSPQKPQCNRGIWRILEEQVRDWAKDEQFLFITTGPVLRDGLKTIGRSTKISVPEYYYKVILKLGDEPKAIAFLMKNAGSDENLQTFAVSIDEVEEKTGLDFYPLLPDDVEKKLESKFDVNAWQWSEPRR